MPKKKPLKPIPRFESEAQEQEFWSAHDSTDYVDWSKAQPHRRFLSVYRQRCWRI
jgi:hypothetical protein